MQGTGVQSPGALQPKNQNIKQKQYCNKFNRDFKKKKKIGKLREEKWARAEGSKGEKDSRGSDSSEISTKILGWRRGEGWRAGPALCPSSWGPQKEGPCCALGLQGPHITALSWWDGSWRRWRAQSRLLPLTLSGEIRPSGSDSLPTAGDFSGLAFLPSNQTDRAIAFEDTDFTAR